ncbi:FkbM family methyltransferase [Candidatus Woesearchaeota archaeon]|nr:FkbM family methyltransferase [Candidatus Woesearchaeota archaeon]
MWGSIRRLLSIKAILHLRYVPKIIFKIKNWKAFLWTYLRLGSYTGIFRFRDGTKIKTSDPIDTSTISVIFIREDYGKVKNNSVVIDIGANIGVYSVYACMTSKNTKVYAYEPMPDSFSLLSENLRLNKLEKSVEAFKLGIAGKKTIRRLFIAGKSPFHSLFPEKKGQKSIDISCITLKDVFEKNNIKKCDILKIDVECAEYEILFNTPDKYFQRTSKVLIEYQNLDKNRNLERLKEFFEKKGYKITKLRKDSKKYGIVWFERQS